MQQCQDQDTLNQPQSLNPEQQNDDQQLSGLPPQQQQQEQQQPNPEDQNQNQNQNQIQQINNIPEEISNINDLNDYEDQNVLMDNIQVGNIYHLPPQYLEQQQNQIRGQVQYIINFPEEISNINDLNDYEDQNVLMDNIQVENVYEDEDQHEENSIFDVYNQSEWE